MRAILLITPIRVWTGHLHSQQGCPVMKGLHLVLFSKEVSKEPMLILEEKKKLLTENWPETHCWSQLWHNQIKYKMKCVQAWSLHPYVLESLWREGGPPQATEWNPWTQSKLENTSTAISTAWEMCWVKVVTNFFEWPNSIWINIKSWKSGGTHAFYCMDFQKTSHRLIKHKYGWHGYQVGSLFICYGY